MVDGYVFTQRALFFRLSLPHLHCDHVMCWPLRFDWPGFFGSSPSIQVLPLGNSWLSRQHDGYVGLLCIVHISWRSPQSSLFLLLSSLRCIPTPQERHEFWGCLYVESWLSIDGFLFVRDHIQVEVFHIRFILVDDTRYPVLSLGVLYFFFGFRSIVPHCSPFTELVFFYCILVVKYYSA